MTQFIIESAPVGTVPEIPNPLADGDLDTTFLVDPVKIRAYKESIAKQMNGQSGGPQFEDLSDRISGVRLETSAQGAGILVIDIIDHAWVLPMSGFIQVDQNGFLWPPVDINFPSGTDCVYRLCQFHAIWDADMTEPNITLTFEDRIVSLLREMSPIENGGLSQGQPNQTLGGFIKMLVDNANQNLKPKPKIRLVEMISPSDPNFIVQVNDIPTSAEKGLHKQPIRDNPLKLTKGLSKQQQAVLNNAANWQKNLFGGDASTTIRDKQAKAADGPFTGENTPRGIE